MASDALPRVFDRFYQAADSDANYSGTGIGLALVKELVSLHRGEISVDSRVAEGSTFSILLPSGSDHLSEKEKVGDLLPGKELVYTREMASFIRLTSEMNQDDPGGIGPAVTQDTPGARNIILIIEDNQDVRNYIRESIGEQYDVEMAKDGEEGVKKAFELIPDLIISDVMMPFKDGYEVCKILKKDIRTSHIPVILLTAKASDESIVEGLDKGADDYIIKPFNTDILLARIKNLIELRRQLQLRIQRQKMLLPQEIEVSSMDEIFLKELQDLVEKNLADPEFDIELMSKKLLMSRSSLYRKITALTGESPKQFVQSYRLKRGAQLLKANFGNVTEVAFEVGFSSTAYFTKCFKEKFHTLPSAYQANQS